MAGNLLTYLRYYKYLLTHKFWVFIYCYQYGIVWRGIMHDNDKLFPPLMNAYASATFGPGRTINYGLKDGMPDLENDKQFEYAVLHHKINNDHHLEYWGLESWNEELSNYAPINRAVEIHRNALLELVADWRSSNKLHKDFSNCLDWYNKNKDKLIIHRKTRRLIEYMLKKGL